MQPPDPVRIATRLMSKHTGLSPVEVAEMLYEKGCNIFDVMSVIEKSTMDIVPKMCILEFIEAERVNVDSELLLLFMGVALSRMRPVAGLGNMPVM